MTATQDDMIAELQRANVDLQQRLDAALARRDSDYNERIEHQAATIDVLKAMSASPEDPQPVFDLISVRARDICGAYGVTVCKFDGSLLHWRAATGISEDPAVREAFKAAFPTPPTRDMAAGRAILNRAIVHIRDHETEPGLRRFSLTVKSSVVVPLMRGGVPIGTLQMGSRERGGFSDTQVELLKTFAEQAVIAIGSAETYRALQTRTTDLTESLQQQTATADVLKIISRSAFDLDTVLETLISTAVRLCNCGPGQIFRREGDAYRYAASQMNVDPDYLQHEQTAEIKPGQGTLIGRVALSKRTVMITDAWNDPEYEEKDAARIGNVRAMLGVPLLRDGEPIGAFALARSEPIAFTEREVELVTSFADQAVIAIENARLFNEVQARTKELSASLDGLRIAQNRLVQTEKLASLGQLTAGIAHEIKNPLNFVNNFSALSAELIDELDEALAPAPLDQKMRGDVGELTQMLKSNLEKVVQHGKRADSIVKNMLLHAREGSGEHRSADINALVEESLNLAYHGARAENPGFNVTLRRDLDPDAGAVELYPQEITRALLNLISNGFYAASQRKSEEGGTLEPVLIAATKNLGKTVEIRIRDNGTGIPEEVKEKIFNPFFTTKPSGEGTGLGLSMSHDIIVKQHGGSIDVETEPGQFTEFIIVLPRTSNSPNRNRGQP
jgi:two-component system NtrC family sensor kinase